MKNSLKHITRNAKIFALLGVVHSIAFFLALNWLLTQAHELTAAVIVLAVMYGLAWFVSGLLLGMRDSTHNTRVDLGWLYHMLTSVIGVAVPFVMLPFLKAIEPKDVAIVAVINALSLLLHYVFGVRGSIKGIDKKDLFQ